MMRRIRMWKRMRMDAEENETENKMRITKRMKMKIIMMIKLLFIVYHMSGVHNWYADALSRMIGF